MVVIFDLDGTLTRPMLDFDRIRAEIGIPSGPILEAIKLMNLDQRPRAESILYRHEKHAAENAALRPGAAETINFLRTRGLRVGILTRNARRWASLILSNHALVVDALHTRDDGPVKPSPDGVFSLIKTFNADPSRSWIVGDYLFDIQAGRAAGLTTVLLFGDRAPPSYAHQADHLICTFPELLPLVLGPGAYQ